MAMALLDVAARAGAADRRKCPLQEVHGVCAGPFSPDLGSSPGEPSSLRDTRFQNSVEHRQRFRATRVDVHRSLPNLEPTSAPRGPTNGRKGFWNGPREKSGNALGSRSNASVVAVVSEISRSAHPEGVEPKSSAAKPHRRLPAPFKPNQIANMRDDERAQTEVMVAVDVFIPQ